MTDFEEYLARAESLMTAEPPSLEELESLTDRQTGELGIDVIYGVMSYLNTATELVAATQPEAAGAVGTVAECVRALIVHKMNDAVVRAQA